MRKSSFNKSAYIGRKFGRLTVIDAFRKNNRTFYICECECGNIKEIRGDHVKEGSSESCGCLQRERTRNANTTHGDYYTRLFMIWKSMVTRCNSESDTNYHKYGAKGITVCEEWIDYANFKEWALSNGYTDDLTIDRIDVNGNYEPSNCRWADIITQARNKKKSRYVEYNGKLYHIYDLAEKFGISKDVVNNRYYKHNIRGMDLFKK